MELPAKVWILYEVTSVQMNLCQLNTFFFTFWPVCCVWAAKIGPNWPNKQCFLAGSSKMAPRILTFSIAMCANYSFYVKSIATCAPTFLGYIISVLTVSQYVFVHMFHKMHENLRGEHLLRPLD